MRSRPVFVMVFIFVGVYILYQMVSMLEDDGRQTSTAAHKGAHQLIDSKAKHDSILPTLGKEALNKQYPTKEFTVRTGSLLHSLKINPIPRIVHQMWKSYDVPLEFADWIKSWKRHNPEWEYWFWTPQDIRLVIQQRHPDTFLAMYDNYKMDIMKTEAARYFILDSFGGFYADIDLECLQPFGAWADSHQCIVSHETEAHQVAHGQKRPNAINTILASAPQHMFFKMCIRALPGAIKQYPTSSENATGVAFLNKVLKDYLHMSSEIATKPENNITVVPSEYFLPTFDPKEETTIREKCKEFANNSQLDIRAQKLCGKLQSQNFTNKVSRLAYANHHWAHTFELEKEFMAKPTVNIFDLVPKARTFSKSVELLNHA